MYSFLYISEDFLIILVLFKVRANVGKGFLLPLLRQHSEKLFKKRGGVGMNTATVSPPIEIGKGLVVRIKLSALDLAGGHTVAKHFDDKAQRHFYRRVFPLRGIDVHPIFKMMTVSALVVHPSQGISVFLSLPLVGASRAQIMLCAGNKLRWRVFGQIVKQSLPSDPCAKAMTNDRMAMLCNGSKMSKRMHSVGSLCFLLSYFIRKTAFCQSFCEKMCALPSCKRKIAPTCGFPSRKPRRARHFVLFTSCSSDRSNSKCP